MTRRRTSPSVRAWQAAGTLLLALPLFGCGAYGLGWALDAAARAVGVR